MLATVTLQGCSRLKAAFKLAVRYLRSCFHALEVAVNTICTVIGIDWALLWALQEPRIAFGSLAETSHPLETVEYRGACRHWSPRPSFRDKLAALNKARLVWSGSPHSESHNMWSTMWSICLLLLYDFAASSCKKTARYVQMH